MTLQSFEIQLCEPQIKVHHFLGNSQLPASCIVSQPCVWFRLNCFSNYSPRDLFHPWTALYIQTIATPDSLLEIKWVLKKKKSIVCHFLKCIMETPTKNRRPVSGITRPRRPRIYLVKELNPDYSAPSLINRCSLYRRISISLTRFLAKKEGGDEPNRELKIADFCSYITKRTKFFHWILWT